MGRWRRWRLTGSVPTDRALTGPLTLQPVEHHLPGHSRWSAPERYGLMAGVGPSASALVVRPRPGTWVSSRGRRALESSH